MSKGFLPAVAGAVFVLLVAPAFAADDIETKAQVCAACHGENGVPTDLQAYLDELERGAIRAALERTRHNRTAAAQLLGITFRQMRYRMQRLGLK